MKRLLLATVILFAASCASLPPASMCDFSRNGGMLGPDGLFGVGAYSPEPDGPIADPALLKQVSPRYTREAMRRRIQGLVELEAVVEADGTVGDIRVVQSLDDQFGLDLAAACAASQWLSRPERLMENLFPSS